MLIALFITFLKKYSNERGRDSDLNRHTKIKYSP